MGLILAALIGWVAAGVTLAAALSVARKTARKEAEKRAEERLQPFYQWQEVFCQFLEERQKNKTGR